MKDYQLISVKTKKVVKETDSVTTDPKTGSPLEVAYDYSKIKKLFNSYIYKNAPISASKYLDLYPIHDYNNIVSLQEGATPLYESQKLRQEFGLSKLYFKYEGANPTGSFKDRGSMVEVTKAIELGAKGVTLASTGNMAASVAAYTAKAGIDCYIFVPEGTPAGKLAQALSCGAKVIQVRADYSTAAKLAEKVAKKYGFYLAGDYCFRQEGQKSIAYEIIEQRLFKVPDYILVPVGVGTNMAAIWKGFKEYYKLGLIDELPQMIAVQAEGASPIIKSFNLNLRKYAVVDKVETVSSAIAVGNPLDAVKVMKLLKESKGFAVAVSDEDTLEYQHQLAKQESIFVEPSSATTLAALAKLKKLKKLKKDASYICVLTGAGLKDPAAALKILAEPPTIEPDLKEVDKILSSNILDVRSYGAKKREEIVFKKLPTSSQLKKFTKEKFDLSLSKDYFEEVYRQVKNFFKKGKKINRADLQYIIENTIQTYIPDEKKVLKVLDFEITTKYAQPPLAKMTVEVKKKKIQTKAKGVGPVDAAINALLKACQENGKKKVKLTDYKVEINTTGTDAAVDVEMKLEDSNNQVVGQGTSPDIIQASIAAFVSGYNMLYLK
ncbi:MAG: threonine synthase [Candidatus Woesebacteria bacterium]|jgi:threonine synthase